MIVTHLSLRVSAASIWRASRKAVISKECLCKLLFTNRPPSPPPLQPCTRRAVPEVQMKVEDASGVKVMVERTPLRGPAPPKGPMWAQSCLIWIGPTPVWWSQIQSALLCSALVSSLSLPGSRLLKQCFESLVLEL